MTLLLVSAAGLAQPSGVSRGHNVVSAPLCPLISLPPRSNLLSLSVSAEVEEWPRWASQENFSSSTHPFFFEGACWLCECAVNFPLLVGRRCEDLGENGLTEEVNGIRSGLCTTQLQMLNLEVFLVSLPAQDEAKGSSGRQGHLCQGPALSGTSCLGGQARLASKFKPIPKVTQQTLLHNFLINWIALLDPA